MLPQKRIVVAEVCEETYSKIDKKKDGVEKRPQTQKSTSQIKQGTLRESHFLNQFNFGIFKSSFDIITMILASLLSAQNIYNII